MTLVGWLDLNGTLKNMTLSYIYCKILLILKIRKMFLKCDNNRKRSKRFCMRDLFKALVSHTNRLIIFYRVLTPVVA